MLAPICLFTYNRIEETKKTVSALQANFLAKDSDLIIFSDAAKNETSQFLVDQVREYIKTIIGFKSLRIIQAEKNKGLANSIIDGVTLIINEYDRVIVLEDDLITSRNFLDFMNQALDFYEEEEKVYSVNGFSLDVGLEDSKDVYFQTRPFPWGWATWREKWKDVEFNKKVLKKNVIEGVIKLVDFKMECGEDTVKMLNDSLNDKNNSWYIRWTLSHFLQGKVSIYPTCSLVKNIGFGDNGTHCKAINPYKVNMSKSDDINWHFRPDIIVENHMKFLKYFSKKYRLILRLRLLASLDGVKLVVKDVKSRLWV